MSEYLSEEQALAAVSRLTRVRLVSFVKANIIVPVQTDSGPAYRQIDIMRMQLLCELTDQLELPEDLLDMVMSLVDQLHGVRGELRSVLDAIEHEHPDVRQRIADVLYQARLAP